MTRSGFKNVLEEILNVPRGTLLDSDSRDTISTWSSLADVQILSTVTSEFGLDPDLELVEAETIGSLLDALAAKHAFSG